MLVEDRNAQIVPLLSNRFWRSFTELNERMTVVTISGFRDSPLGQDEMLDYLISQVDKLAQENAVPVNEPITEFAAAEARKGSKTPVQV